MRDGMIPQYDRITAPRNGVHFDRMRDANVIRWDGMIPYYDRITAPRDGVHFDRMRNARLLISREPRRAAHRDTAAIHSDGRARR